MDFVDAYNAISESPIADLQPSEGITEVNATCYSGVSYGYPIHIEWTGSQAYIYIVDNGDFAGIKSVVSDIYTVLVPDRAEKAANAFEKMAAKLGSEYNADFVEGVRLFLYPQEDRKTDLIETGYVLLVVDDFPFA